MSNATARHYADALPVPSPPLQQKEQKNFRLTKICVHLMQDLARGRGVGESALIELLIREEAERKGIGIRKRRDD